MISGVLKDVAIQGKKDGGNDTKIGIYLWSSVTQIFLNGQQTWDGLTNCVKIFCNICVFFNILNIRYSRDDWDKTIDHTNLKTNVSELIYRKKNISKTKHGQGIRVRQEK